MIKNKIGTFVPDSYKWTKNYAVCLKKFDEISKVADAIIDVYHQMI